MNKNHVIYFFVFLCSKYSRTMDFRLTTDVSDFSLSLDVGDEIGAIGSCFAQHIGQKMHESGWPVLINPFGVLYNPGSIACALQLLIDVSSGQDAEKALAPYLFEGRDGLWHSWLHASEFSGMSQSKCLHNVVEHTLQAVSGLMSWRVLLVTFGTSRVYRLQAGGRIVSNCHREPAVRFVEEDLSVDDILCQWQPLVQNLLSLNPSLQIVFTVSPYRYVKYGLHGSQLSKARLLLAVDDLCRNNSCCCYFPAYEIIVDELRDYRFFDRDMSHPSAQAVDYVWERFCQCAMQPEAMAYMQQYEALRRDFCHRPLHPESNAYAAFRARALQKWEALRTRYRLNADVPLPYEEK